MWFWAAVLVLVPLAYASSFLAEGGPPEAEGCSGRGPLPETPAVRALLEPPANMNVGRDGFFVFTARTNGREPEAAAEALEVEVTDRDGARIPGEHAVLLVGVPNDLTERDVSFSWKASEAIAADEVLTLRVTAGDDNPDATLTTTLHVRDATAELVAPEAEFANWQSVLRDSGEVLHCGLGSVGCPGINFGANLEPMDRPSVVVTAPELPVVAVWEYSVQEIPEAGAFEAPLSAQTAVLDNGERLVHFTPTLRGQLDRYCVSVTVRDVRTDATASQEVCATPERTPSTTNEDRIAKCLSVPDQYLSRWCAAKGQSAHPDCWEPEPSAQPDAEAGGGGCHIATRGAEREAWLSLIGVGALGFGWMRRRRRLRGVDDA